jgi:hypothetical protein
MSANVLSASEEGSAGAEDAWTAALGSAAERAAEAEAWAALEAALDPIARPVVERAQLLRLRAEARAARSWRTTRGASRLQWVVRAWAGTGLGSTAASSRADAAASGSDDVLAVEGHVAVEANVEAAAAGCVVSLPGAREQSMHRDGTQAGLVNAFVPLVDVTEATGGTQCPPSHAIQCPVPTDHVALCALQVTAANGGTRVLPRTHTHLTQDTHGGALTPMLRAGEVPGLAQCTLTRSCSCTVMYRTA